MELPRSGLRGDPVGENGQDDGTRDKGDTTVVWHPCATCGAEHDVPACPFVAPPQPETGRETDDPQDSLVNPAHQVYFRAGLIACREYMARFVEAESPAIAMSIRANWWPRLGQDYGPPRKLYWSEVVAGEHGTLECRVLTAGEVSPTQEALPIALAFLAHADPVSDPPERQP